LERHDPDRLCGRPFDRESRPHLQTVGNT
jgi:hypothetical protein